MQPYFFPYAGYFRLLRAADIFILYDDVQFARRGRVHRCAVPGPGGADEWLTLPLARQPVETTIAALEFAPNARVLMDQRLARLGWLARASGPWADAVRAHLHGPMERVIDFLEAGIRLVGEATGLAPTILRSSGFALPTELRGQDRILALVRAAGGTRYVNLSGGRRLYEADAFAARGLLLDFLVPYEGDYSHLLPALVREDTATLRADIELWTRFA